jgi:glycosyltransferase involved in cell wall biosynthesis
MLILYASHRPPYPFFIAGAARSAHNLLNTLHNELHVECLSVGSNEFTSKPWSIPNSSDFQSLGISQASTDESGITINCGYITKLINNFDSEFPNLLDTISPDIVWTQLDGIEDIALTSLKRGIKTIIFLRDAEDSPKILKHLSNRGAHFICNSQFMADRVKRITKRSAHVIYPSFDFPESTARDANGYITMINPHRVKGVDTFLKIARCFPDEKFLLVESWTLSDPDLDALKKNISDLPNVTFVHRVPDIYDIYKKTKLLLAPSIWEEAFGRVVIEAQSCGIPVIASLRGGLPEAVGDGGICIKDYKNEKTWCSTIHTVLNDNSYYDRLSKLASSHANSELYSTRYAAQKFYDICQSYIKQPFSLTELAHILLSRTRSLLSK